MAELAKTFIIQTRNLGSNLGSDRKYFLFRFVSHRIRILDPTRHVAKHPSPQYVCGGGPSNKYDLNCIDSNYCVL
jgi:hypothetical protein